MLRNPSQNKRLPLQSECESGFSLIETLVVIAIIATLIGLLLPAVQRVRDAANRTRCANNLRQIGLALQGYHGTHNSLPPGVSYRDGADRYPFMSWLTRLLPFVEQEQIWKQAVQAFTQERSFLRNPPHLGLTTVMPVYGCPADSRTLHLGSVGMPVAFTAYLGVEGTNLFRKDGVLYLDSQTKFSDISDGLSNTLCVGERPPSTNEIFGWWYAGWGQNKDGSADSVLGVRERNIGSNWAGNCPPGPYEFGPGSLRNQCDLFHFWSMHIGGAHFLFADGSVRFLAYSAAPVMPALATRSGGEAVALPE